MGDFILAREDEDAYMVDLGKIQKQMITNLKSHAMDGLQQIC